LVDLGVNLRLGEHAAEAVCIALWAAGCRLARVDGVADASTITTLRDLIAQIATDRPAIG
jgi:hypothetical protein